MCRAFEETRNEASMRRAITIAKNLIAMGQMTIEMIAQATELPVEKVQELAGMKTA